MPKTMWASPRRGRSSSYAPHLDIKPHPKNVWQSPENPLAHTKMHRPFVTKV